MKTVISEILYEAIENNELVAYVFYSKFNPPTIQHDYIIDKMQENTENFYIVPSIIEDQSIPENSDAQVILKKYTDPLDFEFKYELLNKIYSNYGSLVNSKKKKIKNILSALAYIFKIKDGAKNKYSKVVVISNYSEKRDLQKKLNKFNNIEDEHGFYNFNSIEVIDINGIDFDSSEPKSKSYSIKKAVFDNDERKFESLLSKHLHSETEEIFNKLKLSYGIELSKE